MKSNGFRHLLLGAILLAASACDGGGRGDAPLGAGAGDAQAAGEIRSDATVAEPGVVEAKLASLHAAGGQPGAYLPHSFADLADRGDLVGYPATRVVREEGAHTWHRADVSEAHALRAIVDGVLTLTSPSGTPIRFQYDRHVEHPSGDWTWIGHLMGGSEAQDAVLTFGAGSVFGKIAQPDAAPLRLTMRDGASWLVETDAAKLSALTKASGRFDRPDYLIPPRIPAPSAGAGGGTRAAAMRASANQAATLTIDVLIGYTPGFQVLQEEDGGSAETRLAYLVDLTNEAYVNSGLDMRIRLVHSMSVNYADATDNSDALADLTGSDGSSAVPIPSSLQPLHAAREQYGADMVTLIRRFSNPENESCGVAWLIGGGLTETHPGYEVFGFSVVSDGSDGGFFCEDTTYAHELGHNLGLAHDVETSMGDDGQLDTEDYGRFTYSFGYRTAFAQGNFYTIMAYSDGQVIGYNIFSNPDSNFCGGAACGIENQADNARTLVDTAPIVASFRDTVVPDEPEPDAFVRNDVDGDGQTDLLWHNGGSGHFAYWVMDGRTIVSAETVFVGTGFTVIGSGDYNGDGLADILWQDATRRVYMWLGNGTGFVSKFVQRYAAGWLPAGSEDVDGDGRTDLLWHNAETGYFAYWLMDGRTVLGSSSQFVGTPFSVIGHGDYNGDGLGDILWQDATRRVYMWVGDGAAFTSKFVERSAAGWAPVDSGDVDGDGNDDIFWHNAGSGHFAYWRMSGRTILESNVVFVGTPFSVIGAGDYNGDGLADVLWQNPGRYVYMWLGNGTGFKSGFVQRYASGWAPVNQAP